MKDSQLCRSIRVWIFGTLNSVCMRSLMQGDQVQLVKTLILSRLAPLTT